MNSKFILCAIGSSFIFSSTPSLAGGSKSLDSGEFRSCIEDEKVKVVVKREVFLTRQHDREEFDDEFIRMRRFKSYEESACDDALFDKQARGDRKCKLVKIEQRQKKDWQGYVLTFEGSGIKSHRPEEELKKSVVIPIQGEKVSRAQISTGSFSEPGGKPIDIEKKIKKECEAAGGKIAGDITFSSKKKSLFISTNAVAECVGNFYVYKDAGAQAENAYRAERMKALGSSLLHLETTVSPYIFSNTISKEPVLNVALKIRERVSFKNDPKRYKAWECAQVARCSADKDFNSSEDKASLQSLAQLCSMAQDKTVQDLFLGTGAGRESRDAAISSDTKIKSAPSSKSKSQENSPGLDASSAK